MLGNNFIPKSYVKVLQLYSGFREAKGAVQTNNTNKNQYRVDFSQMTKQKKQHQQAQKQTTKMWTAAKGPIIKDGLNVSIVGEDHCVSKCNRISDD